MGTPIPWPLEGGACLLCWGTSKPFAPYICPWFMQAFVSGITKGPNWNPPYPEPPNGLFELEYTSACFWTCENYPWMHTLFFDITGTRYKIYYVFPEKVRYGTGPLCSTSIELTLTDFPFVYDGGNVKLSWLGGP